MPLSSLAILSDIHGNAEALSRVFADMDALGVTKAVSLGDNIGYGPWPNEVVAMLLARQIPSVMGNHESAALKKSEEKWFNPTARKAIVRTRKMLSEITLRTIESYPVTISIEDTRFVHGCPPSDIKTYLFQKKHGELALLFSTFPESVCFVGHTHEIGGIILIHNKIHFKNPSEIPLILENGTRAIINCGSVGQPRDGDNQAKYILYHPDTRSITLRRVSYDIGKTASAILEAGLPEIYAQRLF